MKIVAPVALFLAIASLCLVWLGIRPDPDASVERQTSISAAVKARSAQALDAIDYAQEEQGKTPILFDPAQRDAKRLLKAVEDITRTTAEDAIYSRLLEYDSEVDLVRIHFEYVGAKGVAKESEAQGRDKAAAQAAVDGRIPELRLLHLGPKEIIERCGQPEVADGSLSTLRYGDVTLSFRNHEGWLLPNPRLSYVERGSEGVNLVSWTAVLPCLEKAPGKAAK